MLVSLSLSALLNFNWLSFCDDNTSWVMLAWQLLYGVVPFLSYAVQEQVICT
jgi:hypothetical protein